MPDDLKFTPQDLPRIAAQARALFPELKDASDEDAVSGYLDKGKFDSATNDAYVSGLGLSRHYAWPFVKGAIDSINPISAWEPAHHATDSEGARLGGNVAGTIASFELAPLAALKVAKGVGLGLKAAKLADLGANATVRMAKGIDLVGRGGLGFAQGNKAIHQQAETDGKPVDPIAQALMTFGGAGLNALPMGFGASRVANLLGGAGSVYGGSALMGAAQARQGGESMLEGAKEAIYPTNPAGWMHIPGIGDIPKSSALAAGAGALGAVLPGPITFSKAGVPRRPNPLAVPSAESVGHNASTSTAVTQPIAQGSTSVMNAAETPNIPPAPGVSKAEPFALGHLPDTSGVPMTAHDAAQQRLEQEQMTAFAQLLQLRETQLKDAGFPIDKHIVSQAIPGVTDMPIAVTHHVGDKVRLGSGSQLMDRRELYNGYTQSIHMPDGQVLHLPPGYEPRFREEVSVEHTSPAAQARGLPPQVIVHGQQISRGPHPPAPETLLHIGKDPASNNHYQLGLNDVPSLQQELQARRAQADEKFAKDPANLAHTQAAVGRHQELPGTPTITEMNIDQLHDELARILEKIRLTGGGAPR